MLGATPPSRRLFVLGMPLIAAARHSRRYNMFSRHVSPQVNVWDKKVRAKTLEGLGSRVIRLGLEPRTPTLKVLCSSN